MALQYKEAYEANSSGFSIAGGKSTRLYQITIEDNDDLVELITTFLGGTSLDVGDGRMVRTPPLADPEYPWLMCSAITSLKPIIGIPDVEDGEDALEVPTVSSYPFWPNRIMTVEFTPRKFPVVQDSSVSLISSSWTPDVNTDSTGTSQTYQYADETVRYTTDPTIASAFEFVTAQQGNMKFKTNGTSYGGFNPNGKVFPAKLKMPLPNMVLKTMCVQMPYRYLTSSRSYITGGTTRAPWIGRVNQNSMRIAGLGFKAGQLQFINYTIEMYSPPVPDRELFAPGVFSSEKLMNLELTFSYTLRTATDLTTAPANANYIQAGHNLLPWTLTRKFHYAETASGFPSWPSAPLELLWTDPDLVQTVG